MSKTYLSEERYNEIQKELTELKSKERRKVAERLKHAKELGDLSENSEYQEAREEQSRLEGRINQLEELLRKSVIIEKPASSGVVKIGSRVTLRESGRECVYTIVGSNESDPANGLISNESPIGLGLLGHKVGDTVTVKTPRGEKVYSVEHIE